MTLTRFARLSILLVAVTGTAAADSPSLIADAAESRDLQRIEDLLLRGIDENVPQPDGMTALHWAVYQDEMEMAITLVESGANVNKVNRYGVPPLSLACTNGNGGIAKVLLDAGANPNAVLPGGETVLMTASRTGNLDVVRALLAKGADVDARERREQTALMWAAAEGHAAVVGVLIESGADIHGRLRSGFNPMFFAVREGKTEVVRTLLTAGIDVNDTLRTGRGSTDAPAKTGSSPLLLAVQNGHFELALELVKAGADPNDQRSGFTPLHALTKVRKPDLGDAGDPAPIGSGNMTSLQFVRAFVELGADVNVRLEKGRSRAPGLNMRGATAFFLAADRADAPYMRLLIELGADPFMTNIENTTPLMAAAGLGTLALAEEAGTEPEALEAVQVLLDLGADVNAMDDNGETPMHGAAYGTYSRIVQLLAEHDADTDKWNLKNAHGWTPLFIAEGHRPGNAIPSHATIDALHHLMLAADVPIDGPRPRKINESYEKKKKVAPQKRADQKR